MIKINRTVEYSLMALLYMSKKQVLCSAKEVAESLSISFDTTARVMQFMAQDGILKAEYGAGGGYHLQRKLAEITLADLIIAVEGPMALVKCLNKEYSCEIQTHCTILDPVHIINRRFIDFCNSLTLDEILGSNGENSNLEVASAGSANPAPLEFSSNVQS